MYYLSRLSLLIVIAVLLGCIQPPLMLSQPRDALAVEDVMMYYMERPLCNYETMAYLQAEGGYLSLESMFKNMRKQAARIGASGVYVLHTQRSELKDYRGSAKAIRCLST